MLFSTEVDIWIIFYPNKYTIFLHIEILFYSFWTMHLYIFLIKIITQIYDKSPNSGAWRFSKGTLKDFFWAIVFNISDFMKGIISSSLVWYYQYKCTVERREWLLHTLVAWDSPLSKKHWRRKALTGLHMTEGPSPSLVTSDQSQPLHPLTGSSGSSPKLTK